MARTLEKILRDEHAKAMLPFFRQPTYLPHRIILSKPARITKFVVIEGRCIVLVPWGIRPGHLSPRLYTSRMITRPNDMMKPTGKQSTT